MSKRLSKKSYVLIENAISTEYIQQKLATQFDGDAQHTLRALDRIIHTLGGAFQRADPERFDRELFERLCRGEINP